MSIAIGTFLNLNDQYYFQNFFPGETRLWQGDSYMFAGFGYGGGTVDLSAGNIASRLVFNVNELSLQLANQAAENNWIATIKTVWLNPKTLKEKKNYMIDVWQVIQYEHDNLRLTMELSSPLDAVTAETPRRRLTEDLVGAMPSSGDISLL